MMMRPCIRLTVRLAGALAPTAVLLVACGRSGSAPPPIKGAADGSSPGVAAAASRDGGLNRCALLTDSEVQAAIGPHGPGTSGIETNEYGLQSCRWAATATPKGPGVPEGWLDSIEVAVFDKDMESWAREQARGEPISGIGRGARYDATYGQLWFECAGDRFCMVKARTAIETNRQDIARRLAALVQGCLK